MVTKKHFLGFFIIGIQHKTLPKLITLSFYIFEDTTNPFLPPFYSTSIHLGIVEFKIPNETHANVMVSLVTNTMVDKNVSYKVPLYSSTPAKVIPMMPELKKLILKQKRTKKQVITGPPQHSAELQHNRRWCSTDIHWKPVITRLSGADTTETQQKLLIPRPFFQGKMPIHP